MEKLTLSKAYKLLGVHDTKVKNVIKIEFEKLKTEKPWITINDWLWGRLQKMALQTNGAPEIYWQMSRFVSKFEGKSGLQYDQLAIKARFRSDCSKLQSKKVVWIAAVIGDLNCGFGRKMDGSYFPLSENFNPANLAGTSCEKLNCNCMYSIVPKRDVKGRIVLNNGKK